MHVVAIFWPERQRTVDIFSKSMKVHHTVPADEMSTSCWVTSSHIIYIISRYILVVTWGASTYVVIFAVILRKNRISIWIWYQHMILHCPFNHDYSPVFALYVISTSYFLRWSQGHDIRSTKIVRPVSAYKTVKRREDANNGHRIRQQYFTHNVVAIREALCKIWDDFLDRKVHGANMGPTWGRQDPDGPHVSPTNFVFWVALW